jgi:hypothetical protein
MNERSRLQATLRAAAGSPRWGILVARRVPASAHDLALLTRRCPTSPGDVAVLSALSKALRLENPKTPGYAGGAQLLQQHQPTPRAFVPGLAGSQNMQHWSFRLAPCPQHGRSCERFVEQPDLRALSAGDRPITLPTIQPRIVSDIRRAGGSRTRMSLIPRRSRFHPRVEQSNWAKGRRTQKTLNAG